MDVVRIAIDRQNPPYCIDDGDGPRGATVDLLRRAFAVSGVEVELHAVDGPVAQAIQVSAGRADAAADFTITERRARWFVFSRPYHLEELQLYARRHGPIWPGWRSFAGLLGVKTESYAQEYLIRHHRTTRLLAVDTTERLLETLDDARADAIAMSRTTGQALLDTGAYPEMVAAGAPFGPAPLALAALPDHGDVLELFNAGLARVGGEQELLSPFRGSRE